MGTQWRGSKHFWAVAIRCSTSLIIAAIFWPSSYSMPTFLCKGLTVNMLPAWLSSMVVTDQSTYFRTECASTGVCIDTAAFFLPLLLYGPCLKYLSLCLFHFRLEWGKCDSDYLFLPWTCKHPFLRAVEGLSSSVSFLCLTRVWSWQKVGFAQEEELIKNYCCFEVAYFTPAIHSPEKQGGINTSSLSACIEWEMQCFCQPVGSWCCGADLRKDDQRMSFHRTGGQCAPSLLLYQVS